MRKSDTLSEHPPSGTMSAPPAWRRRAAALRGNLLPALPALLFLLVFFVTPVAQILRGGFEGAGGAFGLGQFARIAHTPVYAKVLWTTFWISLLTAALSVLLGYPVAYLLSRLGSRARQRWLLWIMLPFWTSYLVKTYAWMLMLSKSGVFATLALSLGLVAHTSGVIPSLTGVLIGMVHGMLPLAVMTMLPIMRGISDQLVQAAQTLGADRAMGFFTVFLPLSAPSAAAAGLLVFITSLGFFIVPSLLGTPHQTMIAQLVISSVLDLFDLHFAGALATVLLLCALVVFVVYDKLVGLSSLSGEAPQRRGRAGGGRAMPMLIGAGRLAGWLPGSARVREADAVGPLKVICAGLVVALVLPVFAVIPVAFTRSAFVAFPPKLFSLKWFVKFFTSEVWQSALIRSFEVGLSTALLALLLGFGATLALARLAPRWTKPMFAFFIAPLIVPRIVIAVGLLYLLADFHLVGTDLGLVVGHTVLALPYVVVTLAAAFRAFDWQLDDAAKILGASPAARLRTVLLPLLLTSLGAAFLFAFIVSFDDLTIAIFVSGGIKTTLPKQMWDSIQLAVTPTLAAAATSLVVLIALLVSIFSFFKRQSR